MAIHPSSRNHGVNSGNHDVMKAQKPGDQISQIVKTNGSSSIQSAPSANRCAFEACKALAKKHGYSEAEKIFSPENPDHANLNAAVQQLLDNNGDNKYSADFLAGIDKIKNSKSSTQLENINNTNFDLAIKFNQSAATESSVNLDIHTPNGNANITRAVYVQLPVEKKSSWRQKVVEFFSTIKNRKNIICNNNQLIKDVIESRKIQIDKYERYSIEILLEDEIKERNQLKVKLKMDPSNAAIRKELRLCNVGIRYFTEQNQLADKFDIIKQELNNNSDDINLLNSCLKIKKIMEKMNIRCIFPSEVENVLSNPFVRFLSLF
jgi:hypothetical protein